MSKISNDSQSKVSKGKCLISQLSGQSKVPVGEIAVSQTRWLSLLRGCSIQVMIDLFRMTYNGVMNTMMHFIDFSQKIGFLELEMAYFIKFTALESLQALKLMVNREHSCPNSLRFCSKSTCSCKFTIHVMICQA